MDFPVFSLLLLDDSEWKLKQKKKLEKEQTKRTKSKLASGLSLQYFSLYLGGWRHIINVSRNRVRFSENTGESTWFPNGRLFFAESAW